MCLSHNEREMCVNITCYQDLSHGWFWIFPNWWDLRRGINQTHTFSLLLLSSYEEELQDEEGHKNTTLCRSSRLSGWSTKSFSSDSVPQRRWDVKDLTGFCVVFSPPQRKTIYSLHFLKHCVVKSHEAGRWKLGQTADPVTRWNGGQEREERQEEL